MRDYIAQTYKDTEVESLDRMLDGDWVTFRLLTIEPENERMTFRLLRAIITVEAAPGNGTRYSFILVPVNEAMASVMGLLWGSYLLAMEPGNLFRGTMGVRDPCRVHPSYIQEKLGMNLSDAVAMSLILDRVGKQIQGVEP